MIYSFKKYATINSYKECKYENNIIKLWHCYGYIITAPDTMLDAFVATDNTEYANYCTDNLEETIQIALNNVKKAMKEENKNEQNEKQK